MSFGWEGAEQLSTKWHDWSGKALGEPLGRGALYADGFFTTCRIRGGRLEYRDWHLARMLRSANVLKVQLPINFVDDLHHLARRLGSGVLKIHVERLLEAPEVALSVDQRRGYAPNTAQAKLAWQFFKLPEPVADELIKVNPAVNAVLLSQKVSLLPVNLAGLKTLSRLDQVLAAAELKDHRQNTGESALEGITLDLADQLCEGVSHNLCLLIKGEWVTPELKHSGIHGVMRAALLHHGLVHSCVLTLNELMNSQAAVLINSVRGLTPLKSVYLQGDQLTLDAGLGGHFAELIRQNTGFMSDILV